MFKRLICFLFIYLINISCFTVYAEESAPDGNIDVSAKAAILICADSGKVLYAKNENQQLPMASTTKIMTALLAFEKAESLDNEITITDEMTRIEGSSMGLLPGNVLTLKNIARGMMMCSGNDAANTIAISLAENNDKFCELMNEKAKLIGMNDTHFSTASGLDRDDHFSTAKDMATLGAYAMDNQDFYDTVSCKSIRVPFIKPNECHTYKNHNKLLWQYDDCVGIKTGFTKKSGRCLVSCAEKDNMRLIAVTLHAHSDWDDHKKMYDYGFSKVESVKMDTLREDILINVVGSNEEFINANVKTSKSITLEKENVSKISEVIEAPQFLNAPIEKGQVVGRVAYYLDDKLIAVNELISDRDANYKHKENGFLDSLKNFFINIFYKDC